tara:strand:- start:2340 stop:3218 length:879 start_codon:yes stop_codon:yes gene_type:complete
MCIIIYKPTGIELPLENIKNGFESNSDGTGVMYSEGGKLIIRKGFFTWESFEPLIKRLLKKDTSLVIHSRIGTSGPIDDDNCHPFEVNPKMGMVHNGIMGEWKLDDTKSDTAHFVDKFVKTLPRKFYKKRNYRELLSDHAGYGKLLFMNELGKVTIINVDKGSWDKGCWYSNGTYKKLPSYTYFGGGARSWNRPQHVCKQKIAEPKVLDYFEEDSEDKSNLLIHDLYEKSLEEHFCNLGYYLDTFTGTFRGVCSMCQEDFPMDQILPDSETFWCPKCWCHNQELSFIERSGA